MIRSYLTDRHFQVSLNGVNSGSFNISAGVPQGSILGPVLYSRFSADIPMFPDGCQLSFFADDTAVLVKGRNTRQLTTKLQESLEILAKYLDDWKIRINPARTQVILFPYSQSPRLILPNDCKVVLNGVSLEWLDEAIYLGLTLNSKLLFRSHVQKIEMYQVDPQPISIKKPPL